MSDETVFELEIEKSGQETATLLRELADGLADGTSIELADGDRSVTIEAPAELSVEIELERETGEEGDHLELELEFEWEATEDEWTTAKDEDEAGGPSTDRPETSDSTQRDESAPDTEIVAPGGPASLARFQVFRDRAEEWRWRLVHRNGNVIATSGEGYTTRRNAEKGLESVVANAPGADVEDEL